MEQQQMMDLDQAAAWLAHVSAYVRFEQGPPSMVRIVVLDPDDESKRLTVTRIDGFAGRESSAFLEAVTAMREEVEAAQRQGGFQFLDLSERGWQGERFRGSPVHVWGL